LVPEAPSISRATEAREAPHACRAPPVLTCLRHGSHRGKRVGTAPAVSIMSAYLGDAQRGTPVSCRRGDKAAAMASYTKQAKAESLQYPAMRAGAIRAGAMARFEYERWSASWGDGVNAARPPPEPWYGRRWVRRNGRARRARNHGGRMGFRRWG